MSRRLFLVVTTLTASWALAGCNNVTCGKGTVQQQNKDGTVQCVVVDADSNTVKCNADAGVMLSGGSCTATITCGPGTSLVNGQCIGTGGNPDDPLPCPTPTDNNKICINGVIRNLEDGSIVSEKVHVVYFDDPFAALKPPPHTLAANQEQDVTNGKFVFDGVIAPSLGLMALEAGDSDINVSGGNAGAHFVTTASGAQMVSGGGSYRVDLYVVKRTTVDAWGTATGTNWYNTGGYLARYYSDAAPASNNLAATEKSPVSGVALTLSVSSVFTPQSGTRYFTTDLSTLAGATQTSTGAAGAAITPPPPPMGQGTFSGQGGGITWEQQTGGAAPHVIFISRYHPKP